jgi:hypothetical protein
VDGTSYAYASRGNDAWLLRIDPDGQVTRLDARLPGPEVPPAWFAVRPHLAVNRNGGAILAEGSGGTLNAISLGDGSEQPWGAGFAPVWYAAAPRKTPPVPPPAMAAFLTPTPGPSPSATPSATPRPVARPMTLNLTARRDQTLLSGATIVAVVNNQECARGSTDVSGRLTLLLPREGAPAVCSEQGAPVRFQVNGQLVDQVSFYSPQSVFSYELLVR